MSESKHTPEPWRTGAGTAHEATSAIYAGPKPPHRAGRRVAYCFSSRPHSDVFTDEDRANSRRIVAAVNACAGFPTEALEQGVVDELLAALERVAAWDFNLDGDCVAEAKALARAAITKAKGESK